MSIKINNKNKIICLGCNKPQKSKVYDDGSYHVFYQNIKTKEYFCERCIENKPIVEVKDRIVFRGNKHFYQGQQVCAMCGIRTKPADKLVQEFNKLWYCLDCWNWQMEASESGVATCIRYTRDKELNCYDYLEKKNCGKCDTCQQRKKLTGISTIALMTELYWGREDFNSLITWEDDSFIIRFQELIWELKQVKGWTPKKIEAEVSKDIFGDRKLSQRKFSRGT